MLKTSFSTVACPEWTLDRVAAAAQEYGFEGVELRTFGPASRVLACDPALSDETKTRRTFSARGVKIVSLATSVRFDEPIRPPVLGRVFSDTERAVREGKFAVGLAVGLECPLVRVFAFKAPPREPLRRTRARIVQRLRAVVDHANKTGVRLVLENGGSFPAAGDIAGIIDEVGSPLLGACYSLGAAWAAGESPRDGIGALGDRLWSARVRDVREGRPCPLGEGELPARDFVQSLVHAGFRGPLVYEWDRLWLPDLAPPEQVLPRAGMVLLRWLAEARGTRIAASGPLLLRA